MTLLQSSVLSNLRTQPQLGEHCWPHDFAVFSLVEFSARAAAAVRDDLTLLRDLTFFVACNKNLMVKKVSMLYLVEQLDQWHPTMNSNKSVMWQGRRQQNLLKKNERGIKGIISSGDTIFPLGLMNWYNYVYNSTQNVLWHHAPTKTVSLARATWFDTVMRHWLESKESIIL